MSGNPQVSSFRSQPSASLLAKFRSDRKRLPLHPLEKAVLTVVALHLCFLPWALGTMHAWSQITSLSLSLVAFTLALIPRTYSGDLALGFQPPMVFASVSRSENRGQTPGGQQAATASGLRLGPPNSEPLTPNRGAVAYRLSPLPRLLRFPLFWLGLLLLAYIAVQGFNPSWVYTQNTKQWWLVRVNDIPWLPTSVETPFERFNLWRQFIIYASAWLTLCTVWTGFTRRRSLELLLTVLVINGTILAGLGFIRKLTLPNWSWVLWMEKPLPGATSFASFIYKNHAGAYFALLAGIAITLAAWSHERGLRQLARSTPAFIWLLAGIGLAFAVFFTYSRGATLILIGSLLASGAVFGLNRLLSSQRSTTHPAVWVLVAGMLVAVVGYGTSQLNYRWAARSFTSLFEKQDKDISVAHRLDAYAAGRSMLDDSWQRGVGAGGFRFLFPEYVKRYPDSYKNGQFFWEHAHRDWLEIPIELGIAGSTLLVLGAFWGLAALARRQAWRHQSVLLLCLACTQPLVQAWFDFPFQCPAILVTWGALVILAVRWTELESAPT